MGLSVMRLKVEEEGEELLLVQYTENLLREAPFSSLEDSFAKGLFPLRL